ncbi:MAG: type II toxin-antitoxin system VapB family antitoxin, partial [Candidatus Binatia bacterium]
MGTHMKTTIEISDALFQEARRIARKRGTTLRSVFEAALR